LVSALDLVFGLTVSWGWSRRLRAKDGGRRKTRRPGFAEKEAAKAATERGAGYTAKGADSSGW